MNKKGKEFRASLEIATKKYPEIKDYLNKENKQALEKSNYDLVRKNIGKEPGK